MIAVALDPAALPLAVAGRGPGARRRYEALQAAGARDVRLFADRPSREALAGLRALWIVGLPDEEAAALAARARSARVLVNVEDRPELCDFHSVAAVRRGDLLLTVSTGGASPRLAARIRARLAEDYGPEWGERLAVLRAQRATWRRDDCDVSVLTDALLQANGWLA